MPATELASRQLLAQLQPGDRVEVLHHVKVGSQEWTATTVGKVVRTERRRHGLHYRRNVDDKVFSDMLILERDDGSLTTITMDEFTVLTKLN
ncbi:MAG: hypothetical protein JNG90_12090 [Planctomycetaceae bacterium]|nr:hypothetical protein [Planctomycetaceae bacterium]